MTQVTRIFITLLLIAAVVAIGWGILTIPDQYTGGQKIGDAVETLPQEVDKTAEQLEDRGSEEKLGNAVKEAGDDIKESTDR